jgi:hypothetical protein
VSRLRYHPAHRQNEVLYLRLRRSHSGNPDTSRFVLSDQQRRGQWLLQLLLLRGYPGSDPRPCVSAHSCTSLNVIFCSLTWKPATRNYVDKATAQAQNLTFASSDTFILRADYKTTLSPSGPGRNSVRLLSNNQYSTHVAV